MMRREALRDVGLFDERFVKYFEDVDICLRMNRAGWRVMYHGDTYCYHLEQRGSTRLVSADAWRHLRAYAHWLCKWGTWPRRTLAVAASLRSVAL
jgi:GT2 family glycosyltransferase